MNCSFSSLLKTNRAVSLTLVLWLTPQAHAIVDANSQSNTNAPSDGAPWESVGQVNGPSGVYLGAGWVLTAGHVGPGDARFLGQVFPWDGTYYWLTNSDGTFADGII